MYVYSHFFLQMCSQWLGSMAWDTQKQLALRMEGNIIVVVVVVFVDWKVKIKKG
jgi:hypothetical protein